MSKQRRAIGFAGDSEDEYAVYPDKESIWLPKQDAIKWTMEGKLHAVLVHMKNGNHYLRPEYGQHGFVIIT